jgi:antitoxin HicB
MKKSAKIFQYTAVFEPESKGFSVSIPSLPGCISEGDSFEEALENIKEAAQLYIEDLEESEIPQEKRSVVISPIQITL